MPEFHLPTKGGVIPNPTTVCIDDGAVIAKQEACDYVIGFGGGSSMDTAKGIAVAATHDGPIWPYAMGEKQIAAATLPVVAITTTSGTGSQCTMFSVFTYLAFAFDLNPVNVTPAAARKILNNSIQ